jgi:hypothetical protein
VRKRGLVIEKVSELNLDTSADKRRSLTKRVKTKFNQLYCMRKLRKC